MPCVRSSRTVTRAGSIASQKLGQPGSRLEFGRRREQRGIADHAVVRPLVVRVPVDAAERSLGATVLGHLELQRSEALRRSSASVGSG